MATKLEEIRQKLTEKNSTNDHASFPFWNMQENQSATIRFIPDGDPDNTFFWAERNVIRLPFANNQIINVPCMNMFGEKCPILEETRDWWKSKDTEDLARTYYKKRSYIFQGFVVNSPLTEQFTPENPIRRFVINPSIFKLIKDSLMNTEFEDMPTDYTAGRDFRLTKTKKGNYADYSTSSWSFKTRALTTQEHDAINTHGLFTLKNFLGVKPDQEQLDAIKAMFHDSLDGKPFDEQAYGKWFKASGNFGATPNTANAANAEPVADAATVSKTNADRMLERINKRTKGVAA